MKYRGSDRFHRVQLADVGSSLSALPTGGYAVGWGEYARPIDGSSIPYSYKGRYYAANDAPLGEPFVIDEDAYQLDTSTDARGNLIAFFNPLYFDPVCGLGPAYVRVFQGP